MPEEITRAVKVQTTRFVPSSTHVMDQRLGDRASETNLLFLNDIRFVFVLPTVIDFLFF